MNSRYEEKIEDPCGEMARLVTNFFPLNEWGFEEKYRSIKEGRLIYDSQWCRIKFVWSGWEEQVGNSMDVYYGRLHALNDEYVMTWNQENSYCWHGLTSRNVLNFLVGLSPQEVISQKGFPSAVTQFRNSDVWKDMVGKRRLPELTARMNASIWEYYGARLFELFDLRSPDLWGQYGIFLKEYYDIKGRSKNIVPSLDKIC